MLNKIIFIVIVIVIKIHINSTLSCQTHLINIRSLKKHTCFTIYCSLEIDDSDYIVLQKDTSFKTTLVGTLFHSICYVRTPFPLW